jgi:hypothetical protein
MNSNHRLRRTLGVTAVCGLAVVFAVIPAWVYLVAPVLAQPQEKPSSADKDAGSSDLYAYMGAASCSGSACHGSTTPRNKLKIGQNEFFVWSQKDRHTKAYEVLLGPDSKRIAHNLKIDKPEQSARCLVCHAVTVEENRQGSLYDVTEGVSCEGCHGPAENWLGPHIRKDWDAKKAAAYGMYPTKDLAKRSTKCLSCHLGGSQDQIVDHELIGAGHPRLKFELDNYSHAMPAHWQPPKEKAARDWMGARAWAINQAVALRDQIRLLSAGRKGRAGLWPDFVHFECYACHHDVVDHVRDLNEDDKKLQRWRVRDYGGKPGRLVWNASSYAVYRHVVNLVAPDQAKVLEQTVKAFHEGLTGKRGAAEGFDASLTKLADLTEQLVPKVSQYGFSQQSMAALMRSIASDGHAIGNAGFQASEQAVLALASLYDAYNDALGGAPESAAVKESLDALYKEIKDGRSFNQVRFEAAMSKMQGVLAKGS